MKGNSDDISFDTNKSFTFNQTIIENNGGLMINEYGTIFYNFQPTTFCTSVLYNCKQLHPISNQLVLDTTINSNTSLFLNAPSGIKYNWQPQTGLSCYNCQEPSFTGKQNQTYNVFITDKYGCEYSQTYKVTVIDCDTIYNANKIVIDTVVQAGATVKVKAANSSYKWKPENIVYCPTCSETTAKINYATTLYNYGIDKYNCPVSLLYKFKVINCDTVYPVKEFVKPIQYALPGEIVTLNATQSTSYKWLGSEIMSCYDCKKPIVANNNATYTVQLTGIHNCSYYEKYEVRTIDCAELEPRGTIIKLDTVVIPGSKILLKPDFSYAYQWLNTQNLSCTNCFMPYFTANQHAEISVKLLGNKGCPYYNKFIIQLRNCDTISKPTYLKKSFEVTDKSVIKLEASKGYKSYYWLSNNAIDCDTCPINNVEILKTDTFFVTLTDFWHCPTIEYFYVKCLFKGLTIPNVISPNTDGINDCFDISDLAQNSELTIFNSNGKEIYFNNNYNNDFCPEGLTQGNYWYVLKTSNNDVFKGYLFIKK